MKVLTSWNHVYVFDKSSTNDIGIIKDVHEAFGNKVSVRNVMIPNGFFEHLSKTAVPFRGCAKLTYRMFAYTFLQWSCLYIGNTVQYMYAKTNAYVYPKIASTHWYAKARSYATRFTDSINNIRLRMWLQCQSPRASQDTTHTTTSQQHTVPEPHEPLPQAPAVFQDPNVPLPTEQVGGGIALQQNPIANTMMMANTNMIREDIDVNYIYGAANDVGVEPSDGFTLNFHKKSVTCDSFPIQYEPFKIIEDKNAVFLVKYADTTTDTIKYCMIPYEGSKILATLPAYGVNGIDLKDAVLFPNNVKKMVFDIIKNVQIDDQDMYLNVLYTLRKMLIEKIEYGTYLKSVLEFMYVNYTYDPAAKPIPIRDLYTDFTIYNTRTLKLEVSHMVSCNKFEIILQYLGFEVKSGQVHSRARASEPKALQFGVKATTHDTIKKNTSYWTKKVLQLRREPTVVNKQVSPWMNATTMAS